MWHDLFSIQIPLLDKVVRTVAVFLVVLLLLQLFGRRETAQLTGFDFVVMLLLSNVVQNAIIGPDNSMLGGVVGAVVLLLANGVLVRVAHRVPWLRRIVKGRQYTLARHGDYDEANLRRLALLPSDVDQAVQEQGGDGVGDTELITLEPGGAVVVRLRRAEQSATYGDVTELVARLERIERRIEALAAPPR
ncbi:DUF421 domain-containing protein [Actinomadura parmotrematis]|uniref:DUF421 domain-containing protein n=1 Tax=Actinomadura parmotrematis TaxID=2864039 RepID=A0ABS7FLD8_9ACTN|nr:YetF domain-containing protein [Actinomadura parmotrematis]MBW8481183.1 DUF421 domain-containing protein [Actinomadura parmotrematis]